LLDVVARISGHALPIRPAGRRPGDATEVVACAERIRAELGWQPRYDDLEQIVRDALALEHRLLDAP
jgi:UDP-glucose 4-epimerase